MRRGGHAEGRMLFLACILLGWGMLCGHALRWACAVVVGAVVVGAPCALFCGLMGATSYVFVRLRLSLPPSPVCVQDCREFKNGNCSRGESCRFNHVGGPPPPPEGGFDERRFDDTADDRGGRAERYDDDRRLNEDEDEVRISNCMPAPHLTSPCALPRTLSPALLRSHPSEPTVAARAWALGYAAARRCGATSCRGHRGVTSSTRGGGGEAKAAAAAAAVVVMAAVAAEVVA